MLFNFGSRRPGILGSGLRFRPEVVPLESRVTPTVLNWATPLGNGPDDVVVRLRANGNGVEVFDNGALVKSASLSNLDSIRITGNAEVDRLTVDYSAGYFAVPVNFSAGGETDALTVVGLAGNTSGGYTPAAVGFGSGTVAITGTNSKGVAGTAAISFISIEGVTVKTMTTFALTTPNAADDVSITGPAAGQVRVSGFSGAFAFTPLTIENVPQFTLAVGTNDEAGADDRVTADLAGLVATGQLNFTVAGGPGVDTIASTGDVDFTLTDSSLIISGGGAIALAGIDRAELTGGPSANVIDASGFSGPTDLKGEGGNDTLKGGSGNDAMYGGDGDDTLISTTHGDDSLDGGDGNDIYILDTGSTIIIADAGGSNTIDMGPSDMPVDTTVTDGGATIEGGDGTVSATGTFTTLIGSDYDDCFYDEGSLDYTFAGGTGNDCYVLDPGSTLTVVDNGGNDTLDLSPATDPITADINVTSGVVVTDESGDEVVLEGVIENVIGSSGADAITGNELDNTLDGGPGNDIVSGQGGNDTFLTTPGSTDTFIDSGGFDLIDFSAARLAISINLGVSSGVEQKVDAAGNGVILIGTIEGVIGSQFNDVLSGDNGPNVLFGGGGDDVLQGQSGDDLLVGGDGDDDVKGNEGKDVLVGGRGADRLTASADEDLLVAGYTAFDLDVSAFRAIQAEWIMPLDYVTRVRHLRGELPGGANGSTYLNVTPTALSPQATVFDDGATDVLTGAQQHDWFVIDVGDTITDNVQADELVDLTSPGQ